MSQILPMGQVQCDLNPTLLSPEELVQGLYSRQGQMNVVFWYEGKFGLPKEGAEFMKTRIFQPLLKRPETEVDLYSLKAWSFKFNVQDMWPSEIESMINQAKKVALQSFSSDAFFKYCKEVQRESGLYKFMSESLPQKNWLFELSAARERRQKTVGDIFGGTPSLLECLYKKDLSEAYSAMQYVESYFLVRKLVEKGLSLGQKKFQIVFALPNDESKYYKDFSEEVKNMLSAEFGDRLNDSAVTISFLFFAYGGSLEARPYLGKTISKPRELKQVISDLTSLV